MKFRKILLPLDGSPLSELALAPAMHIAKGMSADVVLFHVVVPLNIDLIMPEVSLLNAEQEAKSHLATIKARYVNTGVNITTDVVVGSKAETAIINYVKENEVDLIVTSSHGRSGLSRWRYGSVAARLLRQATCPVLVISDKTGDSFQRILLPLDGSDLAAQALAPAAALAQAASAELTLLRAVPLPLVTPESVINEYDLETIEAEARAKALDYLESIKVSLTEVPGISVKTEVIIGSAADVILDYTNAHPVDLIMMSSHGLSGVLLWTYGSVTEKVLLGTNRPVMVIRRKAPAYLREQWT